jgi:hypothetical protein
MIEIDGTKRTVVEIVVSPVGADLEFASGSG